MEHKRDADAAGLIWPRAMTRSSQDASSSAAPLNPPESASTPATTTLASSSSAPANPATNLGMYSATTGTQPPAPFPTSGHHHITSPHRGRFNKRLVHQIYFKIFTYSNNTQELSIMKIPATGYSRTRDPEYFFFTMTGDWDWSQRTADYWRHFFGVPTRHGGNPFADYYPPDMEAVSTQTPQPTITALATQLSCLRSLEWDLAPRTSPTTSWTI